MREPPRFAERLLEAALGQSAFRESLLGDLREEYAFLAGNQGRRAADRWYRREALLLALRYWRARLGDTLAAATTQSVSVAKPEGKRDRLTRALAADLRYAVRTLRKTPGFSAITIATLALGIGVNAATFAFVDAAAFRPLPIRDASQLVALYGDRRDARLLSFSYQDYIDYRDGTRDAFEGLTAFTETPVSLSVDGRNAVMAWTHVVTSEFFDVVQPRAQLGRLLEGDDPTEVLLSHALWTRHFGRDPGVIGRSVRLNGHAFTVVGVTAPRFTGTRLWTYAPQLWVSIEAMPAVMPGSAGWRESRAGGWLQLVGKLKPGVTPEQARSVSAAVAGRLGESYPESHAGRTVAIYRNSRPVNPWAFSSDEIRTGGLIALAGVSLVLLVACANVASLQLARATARRREVAVRMSLGAGRWRVARQLAVESVLISVAGGAMGLLLGYWLLPLVNRLQPPLDFASAFEPAVELRVAAFTFAAALVSAIVAGGLPALRAGDMDPATALRAESGGSPKHAGMLEKLVVAQVALSTVVLVAASLFTQSLAHTRLIDPGFSTSNGLLLRMDPSLQGYSREQTAQFYQTLHERVRSLPGVRSAARGSHIPLDGSSSSRRLAPEGETASPDEQVTAWYYVVAPEFFETLGVPVLEGREFLASDRAGAPLVAVISQTLARLLWPSEPAVGRRLISGRQSVEVIGVISDFKVIGLRDGPQPVLAMSVEQQPLSESTLLIRTNGNPSSLGTEVRRIVADMDPDMAIIGLKTFEEGTQSVLSAAQGGAASAAAFALLTLLLTTAGLYGVVSFRVARRSREIGVRMALGARRRGVLNLVIRRGLRLTAIGLAVGFALALATGRLLAGVLYGVRPTDVRGFAIATVILLTVSLLASWLPARRAAGLNPMRVLRAD